MNIYKCEHCGTIVEEIKQGGCHASCCGQPMTLLEPGTSDGAAEKHVPSVSIDGDKVTVAVGEVEHPMLEAHFIEWIAIETNRGVQRKVLKPDTAPKAVFFLSDGEELLATYAYCNLHGLWKA
ncbi:MAG: desulfoferrodoxin FeS4 iron-binding domain-containing protein [Lachnospiraceae bacterium]|nr:desulfoferrodoxin FeS4 iron-binding domain-containing protein [Lachnospiraceae bacterium]